MLLGERTPYVGVTGFMNRQEVIHVLHNLPDNLNCKIMVGVLASLKTLRGQQNRWPNRYPEMSNIASIFCAHDNVLNLIHYASPRQEDLLEQLRVLRNWGGQEMDGFQLNITWPSPKVIGIYRDQFPRTTIVLQINRGCFESAENDPMKLAKKIREYRELVDYVLLDASGGNGQMLDLSFISPYIDALKQKGMAIEIGIAGGLSADTLHIIRPLRDVYWPISIDAEGRLRDAKDHLDLSRVDAFLRRAYDLFGYIR